MILVRFCSRIISHSPSINVDPFSTWNAVIVVVFRSIDNYSWTVVNHLSMVILPHNCDRWSGFLAFVFVYRYLAIDPLELFQHSLSLPEFLPALNQLVILLSKCRTALTRNNQVGGNTTARLLVLHWSGQQPSKFVVDCSQSLIAFNGISRHKFPVIIRANQDIDWFGVVEVICQFKAL